MLISFTIIDLARDHGDSSELSYDFIKISHKRPQSVRNCGEPYRIRRPDK